MDKPDNPAAFPIPFCNEPGAYPAEPGMTLRDWFAGQALAGLLANDNLEGGQFDEISKAAFAMADAMLAARTPTHRRD